ncbi:MAG: hypothetical protein KBD03_01805 [Gammaproteobacteria bacterium]|jgi:uncharacterized protein with HEPN domain|nr:hypothetical protein [Gammaproteobacteria bacterium]
MKALQPLLEIADLHANRILIAIDYIKTKTPVTAQKINHLTPEELSFFELYASRFSKLQDFMGSNLFTALLENVGEQTETLTFIDKLNKLEKLEIIKSSDEWKKMRNIRNILSHEYPDRPEITAEIFNTAFSYGPMLLECLQKMKVFLKSRDLI